MVSTAYLKWMAEQDHKGLQPDEPVIVRGWTGAEITRGMPVIENVGMPAQISVGNDVFITWPVAGDNECWLDGDGHLVYIYQEKFDEADIHDQVADSIRRGFRKLRTTPSA